MFKETAICTHFTIFGPLNVCTKISIHCSLAIKNLRTESLLFLFSEKDIFISSYTFYKFSFVFLFVCFFLFFFTIHVISVK